MRGMGTFVPPVADNRIEYKRGKSRLYRIEDENRWEKNIKLARKYLLYNESETVALHFRTHNLTQAYP